jgi:hypothetical protein
MPFEIETSTFINAAFISYFRKDKGFAARLEQAPRDDKLPKGLNLTRRNLVVFHDEAAFTGAQFPESTERYLKSFARTAVIFSPKASKGNYVNGKIQHLGGCHGVRTWF